MADLEALLWQQNPIFAAAGKDVCVELNRAYPPRSFAPGDSVVDADAPATALQVLLSGTVRVFHRAPDGRELSVKLLRAPNVFNDIELLHRLRLLESVDAVDDARVAAIPSAAYFGFLERYPRATFEHLRHLAAAFCVAARNERQAFSPLDQRMANVLLTYAELYGAPADADSDELVIDHPLSQQTIAQALGVTRRSVAEVVAAWRKAGWVSKRRSRFVVHRTPELERLAEPIRGSLRYQMGMPLGHLEATPGSTTAEVRIASGSASLRRRRYAVDDELLVGRQPPCRLLVPDDTVSPQHCRIFRAASGGRYWIEDLGSLNGTEINGKSINRAVLKPSSTIRIGASTLVFELHHARNRPQEAAR